MSLPVMNCRAGPPEVVPSAGICGSVTKPPAAVHCTATDSYGTTVTGGFNVHVKSALEQLQDLIANWIKRHNKKG